MINRRRGREIYPGVDNRFVICDVCGRKFRVKDTVRIVDRYNLLNNMIVCLADADQSNPQIKPIYIHEDLLLRKDYVRPEASFFTYTNFENQDKLPSAPQGLVASVEPLSNQVQLIWYGPTNVGNAVILGYQIWRAIGTSAIFSVLVENTAFPSTYYLDSSSDIDEKYIYQVAIVTTLGVSPLSNLAYFPGEFQTNSRILLTQSPMSVISLSQNGYNIILEN